MNTVYSVISIGSWESVVKAANRRVVFECTDKIDMPTC